RSRDPVAPGAAGRPRPLGLLPGPGGIGPQSVLTGFDDRRQSAALRLVTHDAERGLLFERLVHQRREYPLGQRLRVKPAAVRPAPRYLGEQFALVVDRRRGVGPVDL